MLLHYLVILANHLFSNSDIVSQGSVATYATSGNRFTACLLGNQPVTEA